MELFKRNERKMRKQEMFAGKLHRVCKKQILCKNCIIKRCMHVNKQKSFVLKVKSWPEACLTIKIQMLTATGNLLGMRYTTS